MTITLTLTDDQIRHLQHTYAKQRVEKAMPHVDAQYKLSDATITVYTSKRVVFSGEGASFYANAFSKSFTPHGGSDEVGTGDVFGPVVVVATTVDEAAYSSLKAYPIQDSKAMSDDLVRKIAPVLMQTLPYSLLILPNEKYNQVQAHNNLNAIKAKLHNQAYLHLTKKVSLGKLNVVDQFTPQALYYRYLNQEAEVYKNLHFETKAESKYFAVACASVIARYAFLMELDAMGQRYGTTFPKGASSQVETFAAAFLAQHGLNTLKKVAKVHFKTIQRLLDVHTDPDAMR
jgi:ribonuclease HIII